MVRLIPIPEMRGLVVLAGSSNIPFSLEIFETIPYHFQGYTMFILFKMGLASHFATQVLGSYTIRIKEKWIFKNSKQPSYQLKILNLTFRKVKTKIKASLSSLSSMGNHLTNSVLTEGVTTTSKKDSIFKIRHIGPG